MKTLFTGAAGMLGSALVPAFVAAGHDVTATDIDVSNPTPWLNDGLGLPLRRLDVRDRVEVGAAVREAQPDVVLHLAAETSLEVSDADPDHAFLTNTIATRYVALACRQARVPMVYISTAGVFDGTSAAAYTEFDKPNPINTYGASKYEGERIVKELLAEYYIVRAGWMVGGGPGKDHKFVSMMVNQIDAGAERLHVVGDKFGTPTYTIDFARCLLGLLDSGLFGLYHMACGGGGSRLDVARHILTVLGRDDVELVEVDSNYFRDQFPSLRPRSEVMRNLALDLQGMNLMRDWRDALQHYLTMYFPHLTPALTRAL